MSLRRFEGRVEVLLEGRGQGDSGIGHRWALPEPEPGGGKRVPCPRSLLHAPEDRGIPVAVAVCDLVGDQP